MKLKKPLPLIISGVLTVVLIGGGVWLYRANHSATPSSNYITNLVREGNIKETVNATGTVNATSLYQLSANGGKVTEVDVKVGDQVKAGQVLAKLDPTQAQQQVSQAQANLTQAQLKLTQLQGPPSQVNLISAENSVAKAEANAAGAENSLSVLQSYKNSSVLAAAIAKIQSTASQGSTSQLNTLQDYEANPANLDTAIAQATNTYNGTENDLKLAKAQLAQVNAGANSSDLQLAENQVSQAKLSLTQANTTLANTTLTAPADGIITAVNTQAAGTSASSGSQNSGSSDVSNNSSLITLMGNTDTMQVVVPVNQVDIAKIKTGLSVDLTLDAYPNQNFSGTVTQVNPTGDTQNGVTTFGVTISAPNSNNLMKPGMSANVSIIIEQKGNVLTVPSSAVHTNGSEKTVSLAPSSNSGTPIVQTVQIGLDDGKNAEVIQGLKAGDRVIVGIKTQQTAKTQSTSLMGGNLGGNNAARGSFGGFGSAAGGNGSGNESRSNRSGN
ncbi:efflux RND transporter periplasmic adaptor subunit [Desulfitobacterium sp. Sab5]|uniref:efflux RND transporter periplasmic adaptor subunit n=1 Tax=Desulfitobacterium nosdiversum TaxID=3375356 RepID=UPI003CE91BC1